MAYSKKYRCLGYVLAVAGVAALIILISPQPRTRPQPSFRFLGYTNSGGQMEALFRVDHPPQHLLADGLHELRYHSATGWTLPTTRGVDFNCFGWDGTGSIAAVSVETTNIPARVVMSMWVRRRGLPGVYDRVLDCWDKWRGKRMAPRGFPIYVSNETAVATSSP